MKIQSQHDVKQNTSNVIQNPSIHLISTVEKYFMQPLLMVYIIISTKFMLGHPLLAKLPVMALICKLQLLYAIFLCRLSIICSPFSDAITAVHLEYMGKYKEQFNFSEVKFSRLLAKKNVDHAEQLRTCEGYKQRRYECGMKYNSEL